MNSEKAKIYTKNGDSGFTSLIGGRRIKKNNIRVCAYGEIDELSAFIGLVYDSLDDSMNKKFLKKTITNLFIIESLLAIEDQSNTKIKLATLNPISIEELEKEIDNMSIVLAPLKNFITLIGDPSISYANIARAICRRVERNIITLAESHPIEPLILKYINRLSDYLFTLARFIAFKKNIPDINVFDE